MKKAIAENPLWCLRSISELGCELQRVCLDAIITTDAHGCIQSCSETASDLLGLLPGEANGRKVSSFYAGGVVEARRVMAGLKREGCLRSFMTELLSVGGRRIPVALSAAAIQDSSGEIIGTLGVVRNLTEMRRLADELERQKPVYGQYPSGLGRCDHDHGS